MRRALQRELDRLFKLSDRLGSPLTRREGATDEEIAELEATSGIHLTEDFRDLYRYSNGGVYREPWFVVKQEELQPFWFFSLTEARRVLGWTATSECDESHNNGGVPRDSRVRPLDRHILWLPFADFGNGSSIIYFDADPAEEGAVGQIIAYQNDPAAIRWCAPDLVTFLKKSNDLLQAFGSKLAHW